MKHQINYKLVKESVESLQHKDNFSTLTVKPTATFDLMTCKLNEVPHGDRHTDGV